MLQSGVSPPVLEERLVPVEGGLLWWFEEGGGGGGRMKECCLLNECCLGWKWKWSFSCCLSVLVFWEVNARAASVGAEPGLLGSAIQF